jgi:hypothetical protein
MKIDGKWEAVHKVVRYIECVYVAPITTATEAPVTTTTEPFIYDQATTVEYDSFLSNTEEIDGLYYATEVADLTINGY